MNLNPLEQIDPVVVMIAALIFAATYLALRRVFLGPVIGALEDRRALVTECSAECEKTTKAVEDAERKAREALDRAHKDAEEHIRQERDAMEVERRRALAEARRRASEQLAAGREDIRTARADEKETVRERASDCVGVACEKLLGPGIEAPSIADAVARVTDQRLA